VKITLRLIVSLTLTVGTVATFSAYFQMRQERSQLRLEMERRARLLAEGLQETVAALVSEGPSDRLKKIVARFGNRERLAGVAVLNDQQTLIAATESLGTSPEIGADLLDDVFFKGLDGSHFDVDNGRPRHLYAMPLILDGSPVGAFVVFQDASHIRTRLLRLWRQTFLRVMAQTVLISVVVLLVIRWSVMGPIARMAEWMKKLRAGETTEMFTLMKEDLFAPIAKEVTTFARHLTDAKAAAGEEARLRQSSESLWTAERLKEHVKTKLAGQPLFVVSNREPYMHSWKGRKMEWIVPAGGLVTALEPVMRASGGTWIAHGAGDADWEVVDNKNRIKVPPDDPHYTLRRVALTKDEENGYYYGFSNEGLWPLCHIAHTRPIFRAEDWIQYQTANRKFADAVEEEMAGCESPCVLIQDYHFALLPRLIKERRPDARVAIFWHIPWTNPEAFGICPWQRELLQGMMGADLIGFHTQFHCNNFLDTVDRALESRIDWERFSVIKGGHTTLVKPFPISVAFPATSQETLPQENDIPDRATLLKELGVTANVLAVGVERMDYTKGVLERFRGIERFLEKHPKYQGEFIYVQIGAPSRTHIKHYHDFLAEVDAEAERINWKFKRRNYRPIVFLKKHHSHREILPFYRLADLCLVTSLHDGMNLVAKEFVAAQNDGNGVLILSKFAGASRELRDALIVNPYDTEQMAEAIRHGLEMPSDEKEARMKRLRTGLLENNIYRWAGNLITELSSLPVPGRWSEKG